MRHRKILWLVMIMIFVGLVACGSDPQEEARMKLAEMKVEYSPHNFAKLARAGDLEAVTLFLQAGMDPNATNNKGETALLNAARYGGLKVVEFLLANDAAVEVRDSMFQATALMWASTNGFKPIVELLLDHGADLNAKEPRLGAQALQAAATAGKSDTVSLLLERGADINAQDLNDYTALIWAAHNGHAETARVLLDKRADISVKGKKEGLNALLAAADRGKTEVVKVLLDKGADINSRDNKGKTPLMRSVEGAWPETAKLLLEQGADPGLKDEAGNTALDVARAYHQDEIEQMLAIGPAVAGQGQKKVQTRAPMAITITGKITHEDSGYYIQGQKPPEVFVIYNPNARILEELAKSGKIVTIDARIILGDNVAIEKIDGKEY